jgi:hypothetical protein
MRNYQELKIEDELHVMLYFAKLKNNIFEVSRISENNLLVLIDRL